jgi:hypothetical protein
MAGNQHRNLSGDQVHNPKNFESAGNNTYLIKDGEGNLEYDTRNVLPKALNYVSGQSTPPTEVTDDVYLIDGTGTAYDIDTVAWQSGNTVRYTFNGSPSLTSVAADDYLVVSGSTNAVNNGTFLITAVNDGSDYIEVTNFQVTDATDDEASDATGTAYYTLGEWDGVSKYDHVTFNGAKWVNLTATEGFLCYDDNSNEYRYYNGTQWNLSSVASGVGGSGTSDYVPRFTASSTLGDSTIQDDGTTVGINATPDADKQVNIDSTLRYGDHVTQSGTGALKSGRFTEVTGANANSQYGHEIQVSGGTTGSTQKGVYAIVGGTGSDGNVGLHGYVSQAASANDNVGVIGDVTGSSSANNIGFRATVDNAGAGNAYVARLQDGTETTGYVLTCVDADGHATWQAASGGGGGLADIVDDTTPQLGGSLDVNGNKIVSVSNGDIDIEPNGTGNVLLGNMTFDADQTIGSGQDNYVLTYDHSAGVISLEAAAGGGSSVFTIDAGDNVFGGTQSGTSLTPAANQRCFFGGYRAGYLVTSGASNVAIGDRAMSNAATTGSSNVAIGNNASPSLTSGFSNVAIGREAGYALATAQHNIMIGHRAGNGVTGNRNICMGYYTGSNAGNDNTMIGVFSASATSFGDKNVVLGRIASNLGDGNVCIGYNVQQSGNVTGDGNIFIHTSYAGTSTYNAVSGSNNCVIGLDIEVPTGLSNYVSLYDLYRGDHSAGECYMACPSTAAADADLNNSEVHFSVDETGNTLGIKVKYSSGVVKTATVALT